MKSEKIEKGQLGLGYRNKRKAYFFTKRIFDILCSLIGILFLLPLSLIIKICYVCTGDFQTIFYSQLRIGKNGELFRFYKFRTMISNADEVLKKILEEDEKLQEEYRINKKFRNDPRVTKFGKILRKLSIDELPQLFNVLIGNMSLIGNRPYLPREIPDMGVYYEDIVKTKPGITGLWQVSGRNDVTFKKRLELEQRYSKECSLKLDIKILLHTFAAVLKGDGAM